MNLPPLKWAVVNQVCHPIKKRNIFQCDTFHYTLVTTHLYFSNYTFKSTILPYKSSDETVSYMYTQTIRKLEIFDCSVWKIAK